MAALLLLACTEPLAKPDYPLPEPEVKLGEEQVCDAPASSFAMQEGSLPGLFDASVDNMPIQYGGGGAAIADFDEDGLLDILIPNAGPEQLYFGQADGTFVELPERWPAAEDATVGAVPVDIDADGDLDLFLTNMRGPNRLLQNNEGSFRDITDHAGVGGGDYDSISASFADMDGDGDLDLFVANHRDEDDLGEGLLLGEVGPGHPSELYRNEGNGSFTDVSEQLPAELQSDGYPFMGVWQDLDGDALPELYIINDFGAISVPNLLLHNEGSGFSVWEQPGLNVPMFAMGLAVGDYNGDGGANFALSDWGRMFLMESTEDGVYFDAAQAAGLLIGEGRAQSWGVELADMDNDGDLDLPVAFGPLIMPTDYEERYAEELALSNPHGQPDALFLQQADGSLLDQNSAWNLGQTGNSRGFVLADLNRDGRLDLLKRYVDMPASLHISACGAERWLELELRQRGPNARAIGAQVTVQAGGRSLRRWLHAGGTGFAVGHPPELHFGLGNVATIDRLRIRWPDGEESEVLDIPTNRRVVITR